MSRADQPDQNGRVLERNVALLLQRAYVPVLPRPAFRAELQATWRSEVLRRTGAQFLPAGRPLRPVRPMHTARRRWVTGVVALAAGLLLVLFGLRALEPEGRADLGAVELLARGDVALGFGAVDTRWRAATDEERSLGLALAAPALVEIQVPATSPASERGFTLLASNGSIALEAGAALRVQRQRKDTGVEETVLLLRGRGSYLTASDRTALPRGEAFVLFAGRAAADATITSVVPEQTEREREPLEPATEDETAPAMSGPGVRGLVLDPEGNPVNRFRLALLRERRGNEFEGALKKDVESTDGRFVWSDLRPDRYELVVHAPGLALARGIQLDLTAGEVQLDAPIQLSIGGSIKGYVVDPVSGAPIPGAVVLSGEATPQHVLLLDQIERMWIPQTALTEVDGGFELAHLAPGKHHLHVSAPGYAPTWSKPIEVADGEVTGEIAIELGAGGRVHGRVFRSDGTPWNDALVLISMMDQSQHALLSFARTETAADGSYEIVDLPVAGMIVILIDENDRGRPRVKPVEVRSGESEQVDFFALQVATRVHGVLRDAAGRPVPHQNLALFKQADLSRPVNSDDFEATSTQPDGSYSFEQIAPGDYYLYAVEMSGQWIRFVDELTVPDVTEFERNFTLGACSITGRVLDGRNGETLRDASITLTRTDGLEGTFAGYLPLEADGSFRVDHLSAGEYVVIVYPETEGLGFESSRPFRLSALEPVQALELSLFGGGVSEVSVLDARGAPLVGAGVYFVDELGDAHTFSQSPQTDSDGNYTAVGLRPGVYRAFASYLGSDGRGPIESEPVLFTMELGRTVKIRIQMTEFYASQPSGNER